MDIDIVVIASQTVNALKLVHIKISAFLLFAFSLKFAINLNL